MNIINKLLLRLVLIPAYWYRKIGVNTRHLEIILTAKLKMDDRRPNTFHQTRPKKSEKNISAATFGTIILSGVLGLLFLFSFKISQVLITQLTVFFTMYIFILASTLISDFTSVLIDVRDNFIILPKPVTDKTFVLSRLLHILIHITKIILPMVLPGVVYMIYYHGYRAGLVVFLVLLCVTIFTVFLINIIYLVILKFTSPQKFQSIISYVQIFIMIIMYAGYQIMPRLITASATDYYDISTKYWAWLVPSYWFAMGWKFYNNFSFESSVIAGALITILLPVLSLWMIIKYFAPSFNQKLSLITVSSEESITLKNTDSTNHPGRNSLAEYLAKIFSKPGEERMGFLITWKLTGRLRDFKLKIYPSVGYIMVLIVVMILNNKGVRFLQFKTQQGSSLGIIVSTIYSSSFLLVLALGQLQYSEKFKAAWIYFVTPVKKPGLIFSGSIKAAIFKFFLPIILILSIIGIFFIGFDFLPNVLLGFFNVMLGSMILSLFTFRNLPFSASQQMSQKAGVMFRALFSTLLIILFGLLHYFIYNILVVVIISIFLSALANWLLLDYIKNKSWSDVLKAYNE